jgi:hypothetical protein
MVADIKSEQWPDSKHIPGRIASDFARRTAGRQNGPISDNFSDAAGVFRRGAAEGISGALGIDHFCSAALMQRERTFASSAANGASTIVKWSPGTE